MISWLPKTLITLAILLLPTTLVLAEGYVSLVGIPGLPEANSMNMGDYINALYTLAIGVAAMLAVLRIIFAGAKYMFTDVVTSKGEAKKDIQNVVIGLLVVLSAVLILTTINPNLQNLNALGELEPSITHLRNSEILEKNDSIYTGPSSCSGQSLVQTVTDTGIVRSCVPIENNTTIDLPDEDDLLPGEIMIRKNITISCSNPASIGCNAANGIDNMTGVESARKTCDIDSDGRGEFTVIDPTQGICSWPEDN